MPQGIDHLVIAVAASDAAAAALEDRVGIAANGGGEHPGAGTHNLLAFVGDAYLELIGVRDAALAARWPVGAATLAALNAGGGLATYALFDDVLEATVAELQRVGSGIGSAARGSRVREDGAVVEWWTSTFERLGPFLPPFLIRHAREGPEWGDEAMRRRRAFVHPIGSSVSLVGLDLAVPDPAAVAFAYASQLGLEVQQENGTAQLVVGPHRIRLVQADAMERSATVVLAGGTQPVTAELFGLGFELRPLDQPAAPPTATSGRRRSASRRSAR